MQYKDHFDLEAELRRGAVFVDGMEFLEIPTDAAILSIRRKQLGLTQQEVADRAEIKLRQYQRFESNERSLSDSSLRIALNICDALELDPHRFVYKRKMDT